MDEAKIKEIVEAGHAAAQDFVEKVSLAHTEQELYFFAYGIELMLSILRSYSTARALILEDMDVKARTGQDSFTPEHMKNAMFNENANIIHYVTKALDYANKALADGIISVNASSPDVSELTRLFNLSTEEPPQTNATEQSSS